MKEKSSLLLAVVVLLSFFISLFAFHYDESFANSKKTLSAGTAKVNITPKVPIPMSGYSGRKEPFKGVHDDLFARIVVFSDGEDKSILISADIIGFSLSYWKETTKRLERETGIPQENILLCGTHTHGGPRLYRYDTQSPPEVLSYINELTEKLVITVKRAVSNLKPARIGAGIGECKMNMNRRARLAGGGIWLGYNPYGPIDREVGVVRIDDASGNPMAIFINWPCHGTVMGSKNYQITGDWPGAVARFVEKEFDNTIIGPVTAGASGDINPVYRVLSSFNTRVGEVEIIGIILGEEVLRVWREIKTSPRGSINASQRLVTLPGKKSPPGSRFRKDGKYTFETGPDVELRLSALKIGNIIFTGVSAEVMNQIGVKVKNQSPYRFTFMLTHCNGSSGYVPTDDAYPKLGYEVVSSRIKSGGEKAIIENLLDMIDEF